MVDLVIIGAGPAGLTALLYATMYGLNAVAVGDVVGGKLNLAPGIIDYPGWENIHGKEFVAHLIVQVTREGGIIEQGIVVNLQLRKARPCEATTQEGKTYQGQTLLFATGNGKKQRENRGATLGTSLGVTMNNGFFVVDQMCMTNIPGVFAGGECVIYPHSLEQLVTTVSGGAHAAAGVFEYLRKEKPPILWGSEKIPRI